jgi:hypothetical protein
MLTVCRYEQDDTEASLLEVFDNVSNLGLRWSLPGGLQRIEFTIKTDNIWDLFERTNTHAGQRVAIFSPRLSRPITGWINEVSSVGKGLVEYVVYGGWRRLKDVYDTVVYPSDYTNGEVIRDSLYILCLFYNNNSNNINQSGSEIGGWTVDEEIGSKAQDVILDMLDMSNSSYQKYDFWWLDERMLNTKIRQMIPYFKPRETDAEINWQIDLNDMGGFEQSRGISETFSNITIFYDTIGGTAFSGGATTLSDPLFGSFITQGVTEGDRVVNNTDGSYARVVTVDSEDDLTISTLSGGTANVFANGDSYTITLQNLQSVTASDTAVNDIWVKYIKEIKRGFNVTQATRYANMLLAQKNAYKQQTPFTITSRTIRDADGVEWPILEMIASGGGYIRVNDLYPAVALFEQSQNNSTVFFITSMDYDNVSGQMRLTVDDPDSRLDARLVTAGILNSTMIGRG